MRAKYVSLVVETGSYDDGRHGSRTDRPAADSGHAHIWFGRVLMILGIINGGLGLQLAGSPQCYVIPYSAIAGIAAVLYIIGIFVGGMRKTTRAKQMSPQMIQEEQQ
ncbi:hypothetical protein Forpe1208_v009701 [Fusarium oxysporum f. sp. rapae]|uniref:Uncharacterized protein n=1 Tax=Fusarium oxysporum f. sp. rapae TaxID=485398 RepID=A0A8J5P0X3_FUSOX|nr:hypothetical protein Forpe1208_v009701 [Fusarium oxysporum f. sp. rapae]